jgi:hypothetical protein
MIDDKIDRAKRVDLLRVTSKSLHSISHSSKIYYSRDACEVLKDNSGRLERDFKILLRAFAPVENSLNISLYKY